MQANDNSSRTDDAPAAVFYVIEMSVEKCRIYNRSSISGLDLANKDVWNLIAALLTALCSLAIAIAFFLLGTTLLDLLLRA